MGILEEAHGYGTEFASNQVRARCTCNQWHGPFRELTTRMLVVDHAEHVAAVAAATGGELDEITQAYLDLKEQLAAGS